jgi:hypothetical protein
MDHDQILLPHLQTAAQTKNSFDVFSFQRGILAKEHARSAVFRNVSGTFYNTDVTKNECLFLSLNFVDNWSFNLSVVDPDPDPDPQGFETFCRIRIRIRNSRLWIRIRIRNWT